MKKLVFEIILFVSVMILPLPAMAQVSVQASVPLPPPIIFPAPPHVVVLPETYVYAVPDVQEDIFFYNGWWWRPWQGRWYRSRYYDRGWGHYNRVPAFYSNIHQGWRDDYRNHRWRGHQWDHRPIGHQDLNRNWNGWQRDKHWEKQDRWNVQGLQARPHQPKVGKQNHPRPQAHEVQQPRENKRFQPQPAHEVRPQGNPHRYSVESGHNRPPSRELNHQGKGNQGKEGEEHRDRR
jgi:hypothetical protein